MNKAKIYVICIGVILCCICLWFMYASFSRSKKTDLPSKEVDLRAPAQEVTLEDILSQKGERPYTSGNSPDYLFSSATVEDSAAIAQIKELLRQNEEASQRSRENILADDGRGGYSTSVKEVKEEDVLKQMLGTASSKTPPKKKTKVPVNKEGPSEKATSNPFNSVSLHKSTKRNTIKAYVHSEQTVQEGSTIKMRIAEDCYTDNGILIKKNSPVFGEVTRISGERVMVAIKNVHVKGNILPFSKEVYSKDALVGIWVPGNAKSEIHNDVKGGSVDGLPTSIPGGIDVGSQIAGAVASGALNAGKSATSRQVKKIKVTIKTNYEVYLMEGDENDTNPDYQEEEDEV